MSSDFVIKGLQHIDIRPYFGCSSVMSIPENSLRNLYLIDKKSMNDISKILHCSVHKVEYWLLKYDIARRSRRDANYIKYNPTGDPFKIKSPLNQEEKSIFYLSLGLYWGEGGKTVNHSTRLSNSDPALINIYYKFLTQICQIDTNKVHFYLQIFKDNDVNVVRKHWSNILSIDQSRIVISKPIKSLGQGTYKSISKYGVMTVGVFNTHFHTWMMEQLQKFGYNPPC